MERDVVVPLGAMRRHGEHRLAAVDADHRAVGSHVLEQLGDVEAGSAAHVQDAFALGDAEGVADQPPAAQHVARAIEHFEPSSSALVEFQLAHPLIASREATLHGSQQATLLPPSWPFAGVN